MTNQEIKTVGQTIAQETQIGGNTAARVGGVVEGIGVALDNKDAANGYYQATINGGTITVNAPNYLLGSGGNLRIKMPAAGTTASTLTIGNASAVQLWYNGAAVSAQNTWEANEIISVFYDGTRFMASNSQGGGGKAEKVKYDNSRSGLSSTNVQGAIDENALKMTELPHVGADRNDGLDIADAAGNVILKMHKGDLQTKNFNSKNITSYYDDTNADFAISDEEGNEIVQFAGGHIKTRLFDSSIGSGGSSIKSIKVLFLGNSVTQDHATYLPFLFKNTFGNSVAFEFYIYYVGGSGGTIKSYATNVINGNINADIFSVARNTDVWTNTTGTPIADVITMAEFDVISVAGWANPTYEDITYLPTLLRWLTDHSLKPFELAWLMTQTPTAYPTLSISYARQALEDYPISMLFPPALATEYARIAWGDSYINESGHNREGLPCMLTAYTIFINLCRRIGIPDKVLGSKLRMTTSIWNTLNIPGANGSVESTIDETKYFQAQNFAVMSVNAADSIFNDAKKETFNNLTI